jgi:E3 ubiquitin-protein ligase MARCH6
MEWLSHSQKKYCELCKTSFRFTKLYHPAMPKTIPTSVFLRRAAVHVLKLFLTWCRAVLVASVWLVLLPWCMRIVWRSLFYLGDGGWNRDDYPASANASTSASPYNLGTLHFAYKAAKAANQSLDIPLPTLSTPSPNPLNTTQPESAVWTAVKHFLFGFSFSLHAPASPSSNRTELDAIYTPRNPSLLSDVSFFNWFPSEAANRFLIDVLEGQIITLAVVVAFILIFLIREWVVQQQPVINMVALNNNAAAAVNPAPDQQDNVEDDELELPEAPHPAHGEDQDGEETIPTPTRPVIRGPSSACAEKLESELPEGRIILETWHEIGEPPQDLIIDAFTNGSFDLSEEWSYFTQELPSEIMDRLVEEQQKREVQPGNFRGRSLPERSSSLTYNTHETPMAARTPSTSPSRRPHMPARGRSSIATDVKRRLEEESSWSFANVPEAADNSVDEPDATIPDSWTGEPRESSPTDQEQGSHHSSDSWQQVPDILVEGSDRASDRVRGKGKAIEDESSSTAHVPSSPHEAAEDAYTGQGSILKPGPSDASSNMSTCGSDSYRDGAVTDTEDSPVNVTDPSPEEQTQGQGQEQVQEQVQEQAEERAVQTEPTADVQPPRRLFDRILDWMFEGVAPGVQAAEDIGNDEQIVRDLAAEAPFVPFAANEPANLPMQDPDVAAAAAQAGIDVNDQDAIDDAEDLEGMLELIGMQGPLTGLFQNAMFSAVLISATLACAVWFPYLWGKIVILFMGSPVALFIKLPLQIFATITDLLVDAVVVVIAGVVFVATYSTFLGVQMVSQGTMARPFEIVSERAGTITDNAVLRLQKLVQESPLFPPPTYFRLSVNSHEALRTIQNTTSHSMNQTSNMITTLLKDAAATSPLMVVGSALRLIPQSIGKGTTMLYEKLTSAASWVSTAKLYQITFDFDLGSDADSPTAAISQWTATDRLIAVLAGYAFFAFAGAVYLRRGSHFSNSPQGQKIERILTEILHQAGGVLKVILIISIEMLVFPLYCGLLLDMALLPLFKDASLYTRWQFTRESLWTSGFVHWFIGTCYMFHFALFVSMCRKIMRRGVLYFIRDPDDPQFHPVRDVLERSVTTQLRKIAFSALVYGALVIICLGGVVWSLNQLTTGVLPIHWVSHAPSLELPLDLLFYNFLTPVIIKLYKPSEILSNISAWWFKLCARVLRLSNFLFGEKANEQEGRMVNGEWVFEGRYVRAPASDQARIPKGHPVFVEVDEKDVRKDDQQDAGGVHNSNLVTKVYIPPWFRLRIGMFVFTIWIFAAVAGVSATILPLLFGRYLFSLILPIDVEMNDIHSFSLGLYTLGCLAYTAYQCYNLCRGIDRPAANALVTLAMTASRLGMRIARFTYVWTGLIFMIPFLFAVLIEFYGLIPLHAYLGPKEPHVVHLIQDWTLGFLYARLVARLTFQDRASRPARAFAAVIRDGYMNPNAKIATRCFLLPAVSLFVVSIVLPSSVAFTANHTVLIAAEEQTKKLVWRFAFPAIGLLVGLAWAAREGLSVLQRWRGLVRDEVYLIGERLHNFGDRRRAPTTSTNTSEPAPMRQGLINAI